MVQRRFFFLPVLILAVGLALQIRGAWQDSLTNDEITHIAAGVSYWRTHDFRLNDPHPALFKLWAALPLLPFPHLNLDTNSAAWKTADQWVVGEQFVFHSSNDIRYSRWIVFAARIPMVLLWAGIGWMLFVWSRRHWNSWGGIITLAAYTFDPNFLGHGHLVNNDVAVAGAFFAAIWAAEVALQHPTWKRIWIVGLLCALTVLLKFSGIFIYAVVALLAIIFIFKRPATFTWAWLLRLGIASSISFVILSWLTYGGTIGRPFSADHIPSTLPPALQSIAKFLTALPLPAPHFYSGLRFVFQHNEGGHAAFLLGKSNTSGWWYYFPVAIAAKTPLLTLGALLFLLLMSWTSLRQKKVLPQWVTITLYTLPPLLFLGWAMTSHINIGVRHVFIVYPFMFAALGGLAVLAERYSFSPQRLALAVTIGWFSIATLAGSHTLAYFNAAVGGTEHGHRILRDSNLDWQQDVWRLDDYLRSHDTTDVHIELNAATDTEYFFPQNLPLLRDADIASGKKPTGTYAVSVRWLLDGSRHLVWLRNRHPNTIVGSTMWIYQF